MYDQERCGVRSIAVIGAGPAGVAAARTFLAWGFEIVDVFEQRNDFGGVWNYTPLDGTEGCAIPQTDPNPQDARIGSSQASQSCTFPGPMYDDLETNIPHCVMKHYEDDSLQRDQLFPDREAVLKYLVAFAEPIRSHVCFCTQVRNVQRGRGAQAWQVETRNLQTGRHCKGMYDAVCVASGHFNVPKIPEIAGIEKWHRAYPNSMQHSKFYRNAQRYKDKKVLIVGNSASGFDISKQIAQTARAPVLVAERSKSALVPTGVVDGTRKMLTEPMEFMDPSVSSRAVRFADGHMESGIDEVLFCTGYFYSFPFLQSLDPAIIRSGDRVEDIYEHLFNIHHPTLAFLGLPSHIIPFPTFDIQAYVVARVWSGQIALPSMQDMQKWQRQRQDVCDRNGAKFHVLAFPSSLEYNDALLDWASGSETAPPKTKPSDHWLRQRIPAIKQAFSRRGSARHHIYSCQQLGYDPDTGIEPDLTTTFGQR